MVRLWTASAAERVLACSVSHVLPQVDEIHADATAGSLRHRFLEIAIEQGREAALKVIAAQAPGEYAFCEAIPLEKLPKGRFAAEVAIAYNPYEDTARELGRGIGRAYVEHGLNPEVEIGMTLDVVGVGAGVVYVGDHKTGWQPVTPAARNWQLLTGALGATRAYGAEIAYAGIHQLGEDGFVRVDEAVYDGPALALARDEILRGIRDVQNAAARLEAHLPVVPVVGKHCDYCPAKLACPAVGDAIAGFALAAEQEAITLTPETARRALERIDLVEDVLKKVKGALRTYARDNPIPLADGRVWGPRNKEIDVLDAATVYQVLTEHYGEEVARSAVTWTTTKGVLEDLARAVGEGKTIKARREHLLDLIEKRGGIRVRVQEEFTAYRPKV
jgi:hypothetical protein